MAPCPVLRRAGCRCGTAEGGRTEMATWTGTRGADTWPGSADSSGNDLLSGEDGNGTLAGGDDGNIIRGGDGADSISGGAGADVFYGDRGNDSLTGASGADLFGYWISGSLDGNDTISDFTDGEDRISGFSRTFLFPSPKVTCWRCSRQGRKAAAIQRSTAPRSAAAHSSGFSV